MRLWAWVPAVFLTLGWIPSAFPAPGSADCVGQKLLQETDPEADVARLLKDPKIRQALDDARTSYLSIPALKVNFRSRIALGKTANVNGKPYTLMEMLGGGGEGSVYRAQDSSGHDFVVKEYYPGVGGASQVAGLKSISANGLATVVDHGVEFDGKSHTAVFSFIRGLSVTDVVNSSAIPAEVRSEIWNDFQSWQKLHQPAIYSVSGADKNIVLDFDMGKFVVIDPG